MNDNFLKNLKKENKINIENLKEISLKLGKNYDYFNLNKIKIDKAPSNFFWIGLIVVAMPEAKIIHVVRDARATCWSIYKHLFQDNGSEFSYSFENIIRFYKLYIDLMEFWNEKFPNRIYDLNYDDLTINQENAARDLLTCVDLEFSPLCIDFYKTNRAIETASAKQVRQKLYQGSSDSWKKYKSHLSKFVQDLKGY